MKNIFGKGVSLIVDPPERAADVMHYLITGHLLGNRSLDGVTWEEADSDYQKLMEKRARQLRDSMTKTAKTINK
jgi:hypothetical protein